MDILSTKEKVWGRPLRERDWWRQLGTSVVIVLISAMLGRALNVVLWPFSNYDPYLTLLIFFLVVFFLPKLDLYMIPANRIRRWLFDRRFKKPQIGILNGYLKSEANETRCITGFTSFSPEDWRDYFQRNAGSNYRVELIFAHNISQKFTAIINPFGELYPEEDLIELITFKRIKNFIRGGGIFVHAGGVPFFYSWDVRTGRKRPTSKDLQFSSFTSQAVGQVTVISPAFSRGRLPSLVDTLARRHFGLRTTADETSNLVEAFQTQSERRYVMDIEMAGGTRKVEEWRATTEESPQFIPFLRCRTSTFGEVYPLGAIPHGRGYMIVAGMNFETNATDGNIQVATGQLEKVCDAVTNMIVRLYRREWPV